MFFFRPEGVSTCSGRQGAASAGESPPGIKAQLIIHCRDQTHWSMINICIRYWSVNSATQLQSIIDYLWVITCQLQLLLLCFSSYYQFILIWFDLYLFLIFFPFIIRVFILILIFNYSSNHNHWSKLRYYWYFLLNHTSKERINNSFFSEQIIPQSIFLIGEWTKLLLQYLCMM